VLSVTGTPCGLTFDFSRRSDFTLHETGTVYACDQLVSPTHISSVTSFGGSLMGLGCDHQMFATDVNLGMLYFLDSMGQQQQFASGFIGKSDAPRLGPHGIAYAGGMHLFVGDGDSIWRITRTAPVPEPDTFASLRSAILARGWSNRRQ
jgi:hypothetical protein